MQRLLRNCNKRCLGRISREKHRCKIFVGHFTLEVTTLEENLEFLSEESTRDQSDSNRVKIIYKNLDFAARDRLQVKIVTFVYAIAK